MPDGTAEVALPDQSQGIICDTVLLRIMATTDMHMKLLPHDYLANRRCDRGSLAQIASSVDRHRRAVRNTLLVDNGDFLQGTPLGDFAALTPGGQHPAISAMNRMGYDAAAIGNHDFAFGIANLHAAARQASFPFVAANLRIRRPPGFPGYVILEKEVETEMGRRVTLRIGLVGFLPPQTTSWDRDLAGQMVCDDILQTARRVVPLIRSMGADIIIALAHSGISDRPGMTGAENVAVELGGLPGIDAIIAGHTHEVFPAATSVSDMPPAQAKDDKACYAATIDADKGTFHGVPAVMPGFAGSHLGVIDLRLDLDPVLGWRRRHASAWCEPIGPDMPAAPAIIRAVASAHCKTVGRLGHKIGQTQNRISSYFALIGIDPALTLVNMAQRWFVRKALRGTGFEGIPVLSAAAPFRAGGRGGPFNYTDVAAGRVNLGNLTDIYSFPNRICALPITGAELHQWLERSASMFNLVRPNLADQPLIDSRFPAYQFDVIHGLSWTIDLSRPASFRADGTASQAASNPGRICDLAFRSQPVRDDDRFILATNTYRMAACGLFGLLAFGKSSIIGANPLTLDVIRNYLRRRRRILITDAPVWQFRPMPGTSVIFGTSPAAVPMLPGAATRCRRSLEDTGKIVDGFAIIRMHL